MSQHAAPNSIGDLIEQLGGTSSFAAIIKRGQSTASEMKRRGSIPVFYWKSIIEAAEAGSIPGVTLEWLVDAHAKQRSSEAA